MARSKEFERDEVLKRAIGVFADRGYEGTSTDVLTGAMGIGRQSMYDTFGGKWKLYLECLRRYNADSVGEQLRALGSEKSPVAGLKKHLESFVENALADSNPKCLGIGSISEFGQSDPEISAIHEMSSHMLKSALEGRVREAQAAGEIPGDVDAEEAADFIMAALSGIKVAARGGAPDATLRGIARMALRSLALRPA